MKRVNIKQIIIIKSVAIEIIVLAIAGIIFGISNGEKKVVIFHDYEGIAHHATGAWSRKEQSSIEYHEKMQKLMKKGIEVIFVKVDSHTGDLFNELVDEKCKEPLGISSDKTVQKHLMNDIIYVKNQEVKDKILTLAPDYDNNILIQDKNYKQIEPTLSKNESQLQNIESDDDLRYKEITELYKINEKEAKKKISKMLSKDKEKYILYHLKMKNE